MLNFGAISAPPAAERIEYMDNGKIADSLMELAPVAGKAYKQLLQDNDTAVEAIAKLEIELEEAKKRADAAEYEQGRLKRKIMQMEAEEAEQQGVVGGLKDTLRAHNAVFASVLQTVGEISISQDAVNAAFADRAQVMSAYDDESRTYRLRTVQAEE